MKLARISKDSHLKSLEINQRASLQQPKSHFSRTSTDLRRMGTPSISSGCCIHPKAAGEATPQAQQPRAGCHAPRLRVLGELFQVDLAAK